MSQVYGIILASGSGERVNSHIPKQFLKIAGKTVLEHTIDVFERHHLLEQLILVVHPDFIYLVEDIILKNQYRKIAKIVPGGKTRRESSAIGVAAIDAHEGLVLIHDAVRPFVSERIISDCLDMLSKYKAVDVAIPATDTIIRVNEKEVIEEVPLRRNLRRGQTPQAFHLSIIRQAHKLAKAEGAEATDDCGLVLKYGLADIFVVQGDEFNIKITYMEDISLAEKIFQLRSLSVPGYIDLAALRGRVVVVLGASRGIGQSICVKAKEYGALVHGFSRSNGVDVSSYSAVADALAQVANKEGRIDHIIHTAGVMNMGKIETRSMAQIAQEININYLGSIHTVKASIPHLRASQGSMALFSSSSYTRGRALYAIYSSTKAALVNLVQGMAEELLLDRIRINIMNPERTATPMRSENFADDSPEELLHSEDVATATLKTVLSDLTGLVVDVRKHDNHD